MICFRSPVLLLAVAGSLACQMPADDGAYQPPIVGGKAVPIAQRPWQVSLQNELGHFCGGAIVAPEWILTAQHCVTTSEELVVVAGVSQLSESGQQVEVAAVHKAPGYVDARSGKDVALLRLATPLNLSGPNARAIEIVTAMDEATGMTAPGTPGIVSGWGANSAGSTKVSDKLHTVTVPIVANAAAQAAYPDVAITSDQLAAGHLGVGGKDACQGDSGGPLAVRLANGTHKLAGVVSWGDSCGDPDLPGMYARVASFETWIRATMNGEQGDDDEAPVCFDNEGWCVAPFVILPGQTYCADTDNGINGRNTGNFCGGPQFGWNSNEQVWAFTVATPGPHTVRVTPLGAWDVGIYVTDGFCSPEIQCLGQEDDHGIGEAEEFTFFALTMGTYAIFVDGVEDSTAGGGPRSGPYQISLD